MRARGHHVVGTGGGASTDDGGGDPMGVGHWIEVEEGTGEGPDMKRRAVAYPSGGSMAR
jgi:hypothetical protein